MCYLAVHLMTGYQTWVYRGSTQLREDINIKKERKPWNNQNTKNGKHGRDKRGDQRREWKSEKDR